MRLLYAVLILGGCTNNNGVCAKMGDEGELFGAFCPDRDRGGDVDHPPSDEYYGDEYSDDYAQYTQILTVLVDWDDDGFYPSDTDNDGSLDSGCDDIVFIAIDDPLQEQDWLFGMAPTGLADGWFGEDCYLGGSEGVVCHEIGLTGNLGEVPDCDVRSVVPGQLTFHNAGTDPFMTYYLEDSLGNCFVWGHSPEYYDPLQCTWMW